MIVDSVGDCTLLCGSIVECSWVGLHYPVEFGIGLIILESVEMSNLQC